MKVREPGEKLAVFYLPNGINTLFYGCNLLIVVSLFPHFGRPGLVGEGGWPSVPPRPSPKTLFWDHHLGRHSEKVLCNSGAPVALRPRSPFYVLVCFCSAAGVRGPLTSHPCHPGSPFGVHKGRNTKATANVTARATACMSSIVGGRKFTVARHWQLSQPLLR